MTYTLNIPAKGRKWENVSKRVTSLTFFFCLERGAMEAWLMWGLGILLSIITGAMAYYIKRLIAKGDERQKQDEAAMQKRMDSMEANLSGQIGKVQQAMESRIDKSEAAIEKLECRFNDLVKDIPRTYVDKESWMIQNQNIDRKLDRIMEILMGRAQSNG